MIQVLRAVDKANGYCFGDMEERNLQAMMSAAVGADFQFDSYPFLIAAVTHCDSSGFQSKGFFGGRGADDTEYKVLFDEFGSVMLNESVMMLKTGVLSFP